MGNARNPKQKFSAPVVREIPLTADELLRALLSISSHRRLSVLDSCGTGQPSANYLIAGFDPFEIIESWGNQLRISTRDEIEYAAESDLPATLDERLAEYRVESALPDGLPVAGACIATFSYELAYRLERLRLNSSAPSVPDEPDATLAFYDTLVVHDYRKGKTQVVGVAGFDRVADIADAVLEAHSRAVENPAAAQPAAYTVESNFTREEYLAKVRLIKEHIAAGDIYQANLTQQLTCALSAESKPEDIFLRLRRDYPAPFAAFLRRGEDVVISASPERFLRVEAVSDVRHVEAWPIKGTCPRGGSADEDNRLRAELLTSEKDRAENVMIVDLLRNDLGRVCRYGSVEVVELCALEEHPTLFHLVSKVRGVLRAEITAGALVRAAFPCGSITGAPKIRAMEIIADVETRPRGLSMGAIGYFSFTGLLDLNVAIRTMRLRDHVAVFNVGGGIVTDSCPSLEYEESLLKARALLFALGTRN